MFKSTTEMKKLLVKFSYEDEDEKSRGNQLHNLIKHMSLCHSVYVEPSTKQYEAVSPDELGAVIGSSHMGYTCVERTKDRIKVQISFTKKEEEYKILKEMPFDSKRKK